MREEHDRSKPKNPQTPDRRSFLANIGYAAAAGFAFLGFPGRAMAGSGAINEGELAKKLIKAAKGEETEFPSCPPFNQYADGGYCTSFACAPSFHCVGGWDDDFECGTFVCSPQFTCANGFDAADCDSIFKCNVEDEFGCFNYGEDFDASGCGPQRFLCGVSDGYSQG